MSDTNLEYVEIKCGMSDPNGKLIPGGVKETFTALIFDELVIWFFKDVNTTKRFVKIFNYGELEDFKEKRSMFSEKDRKAITAHPGKKKEVIQKELLDELKAFGGYVI